MQKDLVYDEPAVFRRTSMLVNFEIDEKIKYNPVEFSSTFMREDLTPWTLFLIAGQQRQQCNDSMQYYYPNSETFEDWQFLHAADHDNVDETLFKGQSLDDNNNINYCVKDNGLIYMDGNHTRVSAESFRRPDDVEAIYNEETGETNVKLWQCLYPIDPKCKLSSEMSFVEEGEHSGMESKCRVICETGHNMSTEIGNQFVNIKPEQENDWTLGLDSTTRFHRFASTKCKNKTDDLAKNFVKSDEQYVETCTSGSDLCVRNGSSASFKKTNFSYQLLNDQSCNSSFYCHQNTQAEERSLLYHQESSNSFDYDYQFDNIHKTDDNAANTAEETVLNYESAGTNNHTSIVDSSFQCQYNQVMTQTSIFNATNPSFTTMPEPMSDCEDNQSLFPNSNHATRTEPPNRGRNNTLPFKGSAELICKDKRQTIEAAGFKTKKMKRGCRLWEYIRNLLLDPCTNPSLIKWEDRNEGTFKLVENKKIAFNWGWKKGNTDMSYEKLSRAMRYYYKKKIFQPVIGKRLVYKFGPNATGWKEDIKPR